MLPAGFHRVNLALTNLDAIDLHALMSLAARAECPPVLADQIRSSCPRLLDLIRLRLAVEEHEGGR